MQIFLSFSRTNLEKAFDICTALEEAGHTVFEEYNLRGEYRPEWANDLLNADAAIALFSPAYKQSKRVWAHLTIVQQAEKNLIPVLVEGEEKFAVPFGFENYEYIDARTDFDLALKQIVERVMDQKHSKDNLDRKSIIKEVLTIRTESGEAVIKNINKIFVAYSRKQRDVAKSLYELLVANGQFAFWDAKLRAGANWRQTIQRALDECTHLIVIWTPDAAESDEVEREVSYALAKRKTIIPILSKEIPELPYHLYGLHYLVLQEELKAIESTLIEAIEQFATDDDLFS
ncbi:MAG TPA: toll/interleukin-1 receptor domain-containing protein [Phototrophicaceae bacterium]|jgi:hypothetical protein|nr:toll/interleukin-1 receptor domain-containing protein [Phototrophicaceae bacterium]